MKNGRYESFAEVCKDYFHINPSNKKKNEEKLKSQQEKFNTHHKCKACKEPLVWIKDTSILVCGNDNCKGIEITKTDIDGKEYKSYITSFEILDEIGMRIAKNIFGEV